MIFTTLLSITHILILLLIRVAILYFFIKAFGKKVNLSTIFKLILFYELIAFFVFLFYSNSIKGRVMYQYGGNLSLLLFIFLLFCIILFLVFNFLLKKFTLVRWKKAIIIFIVINLTIPLIDFVLQAVSQSIYDMSIFQQERQEMGRMIEETNILVGFWNFQKKYPILRVTGEIYHSLLGITQYFIPINS